MRINWTGKSFFSMKLSFPVFSNKIRYCTFLPTGARSFPPVFNCCFRSLGITGGAAVRMMASKGTFSGQPWYPSPWRTVIFSTPAFFRFSFALRANHSIISML
jgi:hypothetical protein